MGHRWEGKRDLLTGLILLLTLRTSPNQDHSFNRPLIHPFFRGHQFRGFKFHFLQKRGGGPLPPPPLATPPPPLSPPPAPPPSPWHRPRLRLAEHLGLVAHQGVHHAGGHAAQPAVRDREGRLHLVGALQHHLSHRDLEPFEVPRVCRACFLDKNNLKMARLPCWLWGKPAKPCGLLLVFHLPTTSRLARQVDWEPNSWAKQMRRVRSFNQAGPMDPTQPLSQPSFVSGPFWARFLRHIEREITKFSGPNILPYKREHLFAG